MLHNFYEDDSMQFLYSEDYKNFDEGLLLRIYAKSFNEKRERMDTLEFYLPSYTVIHCDGFTFDRLEKIITLVKQESGNDRKTRKR